MSWADGSPVSPDSSDSTARPAPWRTGSAAASAARSRWYWPGRVPAGPQLVEAVQRGTHGADRLVEDLEQLDLVHGSRTILAIGAMAGH